MDPDQTFARNKIVDFYMLLTFTRYSGLIRFGISDVRTGRCYGKSDLIGLENQYYGPDHSRVVGTDILARYH